MPRIMTVRPPDNLHTKLRYHSAHMGMTLNGLVLQILWDWVERREAVSGAPDNVQDST